MEYRYINLRTNSNNDVFISSKNFVNFGLVTPEFAELICELILRPGKKTGVFSRISPNILDRFSHYFHRIKVLWVHMIDFDFVFQFAKARCYSNQTILEEVMNAD